MWTNYFSCFCFISYSCLWKNMAVSESILNKFAFCYFILTCLGFLFHLQEIIRKYFLYRTVNRIEVHLDDLMPTPHLSLCFRYWDILPNDIQSQTDMDDLSLEEIFNKTPRVQETLKNCLVRDPEKHFMLNNYKTSSECLESVDVIVNKSKEDGVVVWVTVLPRVGHDSKLIGSLSTYLTSTWYG